MTALRLNDQQIAFHKAFGLFKHCSDRITLFGQTIAPGMRDDR